MAFVFKSQYGTETEECVLGFYKTLSEKDRRRFAALEALRLGHGAVKYVAGVFGCSERTIERGLAELSELPNDPAAGRLRRPGGGRKKKSSRNRDSNRT